MMSWIFVVAGVSMLLVLYILGRRDQGKVRRDWELLLKPRDSPPGRSGSSGGQDSDPGGGSSSDGSPGGPRPS